MADVSKKVIYGSMGVAGLVILVCLLDLVLGMPFAGMMVMDIMFLIGAGIVLYLGWDALQDLR
ncbi:MAG: hypothetical protein ACREJB_06545 [Planctomycetaceae bacterium]